MALRTCARHGCPEVGAPAVCGRGDCPGTRKRRMDALRPSAASRLYTARWRAASKGFLRLHPYCRQCTERATVTDHIEPHRGDRRLFWARSNWQPLCKRHHDSKTASESMRDERGRFA